MLTIFTVLGIGIVLFTCLNMVESQNISVARCQAWHGSMAMVEAGIEESMGHLNSTNNLTSDGWTYKSGTYNLDRRVGDSVYSESIIMTNPLQPVILSIGYAPIPLTKASAQTSGKFPPFGQLKNEFLSRTVQVTARKRQIFVKGMAAKQQITMNGNNITTDSFDSRDPNYNDGFGHYTNSPTKIKDNGDVSTVSGLANAAGIGNANIKGRLQTGPGGTAAIGPNGKVGSLAWHASSGTGIQPGWFSDDLNVTFPSVSRPFTISQARTNLPPGTNVSGLTIIGTNSYNYVLSSTNYEVASINLSGGKKIAVTGNAVLVVDTDLSISGGGSRIDIIPPGTLKLYMAGTTASLGGDGFNNLGWATNFTYYGLPSNTTLKMSSSGDFTGAIYAPDSDLQMSGGGSGTQQNFVGSCIMRNITVNGHYSFHYDEALGKYGPPSIFVITSWLEL